MRHQPRNKKRRKTLIITDPIHQVMNLGSDPRRRKLFYNIIDTREFQRLRRISQLGLASYVFPGATHSRFSHSLGVAYLARNIMNHLSEWGTPKLEDEISCVFDDVLMAALLHDVGHGPFSHSFENVLKSHPWAPLHEDWTALLIGDERYAINRVLKSSGVDASRVGSVFSSDAQNSLPAPFKQIVSSQLDADRMDYLLRDSHFAGVAVGQFDAQYLINSMVVIEHCSSTRTLGITAKGVKAYEGFLLARQLMNRTVYFHHNVKVLEFMAELLFRLVIDGLNDFCKEIAVDRAIPPYFRKIKGATKGRRISKSDFMEESANEYLQLTEDVAWVLISAIANSSGNQQAKTLAARLFDRSILRHNSIEFGKQDLLREILLEDGLVENEHFAVLNVKTTMYRGTAEDRVFVLDRNGDIDEVAKHSDTITAFRDRPEGESLLVVIDHSKVDRVTELAEKAKCLVPHLS